MKAEAVLVLVVFVALGMDMACAQKLSTTIRPQTSKVCPPVPEGVAGLCAEFCSGDDSCPEGMKCCSNGCGHACKYPVSFKKKCHDQPCVSEEWLWQPCCHWSPDQRPCWIQLPACIRNKRKPTKEK